MEIAQKSVPQSVAQSENFLQVNDTRTSETKPGYLIVVDTRMISTLEAAHPKHVFISFEHEISESPHILERAYALGTVSRSYSFVLPGDQQFAPGSRKLFFVSSDVQLDRAHRVRCWVNFEGLDVTWRPEFIYIYQLKDSQNGHIPAFGCFQQHFWKVNEFFFTGELSLTGKKTELQTVSSYVVRDLVGSKPSMPFSPIGYLKRNFFVDTLWFSIFLNHPWSFCNRSARIALATMAVSVASVSNLMWYKNEKGPQIEIGPLRFSPAILFNNFITAMMTAIPTFFFTIIFNNTAPKAIRK